MKIPENKKEIFNKDCNTAMESMGKVDITFLLDDCNSGTSFAEKVNHWLLYKHGKFSLNERQRIALAGVWIKWHKMLKKERHKKC